MLIDSHSLIYRAYFALLETPLTTSKGQLVNAAFGFWSIVLRGFQDVKPDYVIACFDVGRTFRHDRFTEYKATRRPTPDDLRDQFPIIREILAAFRIPVHQLEGFEADDLIGTLTRQAEEQGNESVIVSGDLDMLQLVTEQTKLMTTRMGVQSTVIYDPEEVADRYGLAARQMIDFKALKGDSTDNIPGIAGVGDKTASGWLQQFESLEGVYENLDEVKPARFQDKLREARDDVFLWRELVTIDRDVPIELDLSDGRLGDYDRAEVLRLFREYEFRTLVERLPAVTGEEGREPGELLREADRSAPVPAALVPGRELSSRGRQASQMGEGSGLQLSLDFGAVSSAAVVEPVDGACRLRRRRLPNRAHAGRSEGAPGGRARGTSGGRGVPRRRRRARLARRPGRAGRGCRADRSATAARLAARSGGGRAGRPHDRCRRGFGGVVCRRRSSSRASRCPATRSSNCSCGSCRGAIRGQNRRSRHAANRCRGWASTPRSRRTSSTPPCARSHSATSPPSVWASSCPSRASCVGRARRRAGRRRGGRPAEPGRGLLSDTSAATGPRRAGAAA